MVRVRNDDVQRRTGAVRELTEREEQRILKWFRHVVRMEEHLVKKIIRSDVRG